MPLYGNELDRSVNPYEANLGRVVKMEKGEFVGRSALAAVQQTGPQRRLVGLVMRDEAIARHGYPVLVGGTEAGAVTSGTLSPTLGERIAMAYLPAAEAVVGGEVEVLVRDRPHPAEQVKLPFYRRPKPDAA
jgi:aminomethyltransferase